MKGRLPNLDILRLMLALEVLVLHTYYRDTGVVLWLPIHPVATFVCISGYLIPRSFSDSTGWRHFAWKRLLRVAPALALAHVIVLALYGGTAAWQTFVMYLTAGMAGSLWYDGALWSLMVEEVLYAQHALSRLVRRVWRVETALLLFVVACAAYARFSPGTMHTERFLRLVAAFFLGNVLSFQRERLGRVRPYAAAVVFVSALCLVNFGGLSLMLYMIADSVVCASVVVFALTTPQVKRRVHDISYGVYVFHGPFITLFAWQLHLHGALLWLTVCGSVLSVASLSWFLLEGPALRWKDVFVPRPSSGPVGEHSLEAAQQARIGVG